MNPAIAIGNMIFNGDISANGFFELNGDLSGNDASFNVVRTSGTMAMGGHIIPTTNNTFEMHPSCNSN